MKKEKLIEIADFLIANPHGWAVCEDFFDIPNEKWYPAIVNDLKNIDKERYEKIREQLKQMILACQEDDWEESEEPEYPEYPDKLYCSTSILQ